MSACMHCTDTVVKKRKVQQCFISSYPERLHTKILHELLTSNLVTFPSSLSSLECAVIILLGELRCSSFRNIVIYLMSRPFFLRPHRFFFFYKFAFRQLLLRCLIFLDPCIVILTFRRLMLYIYGAPILDVSRSHTTTQHSR